MTIRKSITLFIWICCLIDVIQFKKPPKFAFLGVSKSVKLQKSVEQCVYQVTIDVPSLYSMIIIIVRASKFIRSYGDGNTIDLALDR